MSIDDPTRERIAREMARAEAVKELLGQLTPLKAKRDEAERTYTAAKAAWDAMQAKNLGAAFLETQQSAFEELNRAMEKMMAVHNEMVQLVAHAKSLSELPPSVDE